LHIVLRDIKCFNDSGRNDRGKDKISMHGGEMKRRLMLWAAGVALLGAAVLPLVFHAQPAPLQPGAPPATARAAAATPAPQHHPRIEAAINHLEEAKRELEAAPEEFHGHRAKAIAFVDRALEQCHRALESVR
jgi:hypothetical protein